MSIGLFWRCFELVFLALCMTFAIDYVIVVRFLVCL